MSQAHAKLVASLDDSKVKSSLTAMERDLGAFTRAAGREFSKVDREHAQMATSIVRKEQQMISQIGKLQQRGIGYEKLGQGVLAGAAVARTIGTSASVAGQLAQSAQMAGAFLGPKGIVVAGLIAAGAAMAENLTMQREMVAQAKAEAITRERTRDIAGRQSAVRANDSVLAETLSLQRRSVMKPAEADMHERRDQLKRDIAKIENRKDLPDDVKAEHIRNLENRFMAQGKLDLAQGKRGRDEEMIDKFADPVLEKARRMALGTEGRRAEDAAERQRNRHLRAAAGQIADREDQRKRDELGRPADWTQRELKGRTREEMEAQRQARFDAAQAKQKGLVSLDEQSIKAIVDAINGIIAK